MLRVSARQWKPGSKILSENQLATKFKCSRLTAREALQSLVNSGILSVRQGDGYYVVGSEMETSLVSFKKQKHASKTILEDAPNKTFLLKFFKINSSKYVFIFLKKYLDKKGLIAVQYTLLNRMIVWKKDNVQIQKSLTEFLAKKDIPILYSDFDVQISSNCPEIQKQAQYLGWDTLNFPIEIINSYSHEGWIEKSIRITKPKKFKTHFQKRNYL